MRCDGELGSARSLAGFRAGLVELGILCHGLPILMTAPVATAPRIALLTSLAMLAFAGNSLLCRLALANTGIDAASFTLVRLGSGALLLWLFVGLRSRRWAPAGSWTSALALFVYAAAFSFAYLSLTAATGALLLFASVQATMIGRGLWAGERFSWLQSAGLMGAAAGLIGLLWPGLSAPSARGSLLMVTAGVAWGVYSLRGRGQSDPLATTAGNFARAVPAAVALMLTALPWARLDALGIAYAVASGALASGLGYALWYTALPGLTATRAAIVQLSVPVITALAGVALLAEPLSFRLGLACIAILGGIACVIGTRR